MQHMGEALRSRILVIDDDPSILELITTRLEIAGYLTFYARDGREGLNRIADVRPAAMVLDINMPRLDGFGVLMSMGPAGTASIPTMVLTARNQQDDVRRAISLGARDFLAKPFNDQHLLSRVGRLLRRPKPVTPVGASANDDIHLL